MRILYIEDSITDAEAVRQTLEHRMPEAALDIITTVAAGKESLSANSYDLLLANMDLADGNSFDLLSYLREREMEIPVVVLTDAGEPDIAMALLKAGADDYLSKRDDYLERLPHILNDTLNLFQVSRGNHQQLRVLYAESDEIDAEYTCRHLARYAPYIDIEVVTTATEVLTRLPSIGAIANVYDVLLLDYRLPDTDGLELTRILRVERKYRQPIVLISAQGNEEVAVWALRQGVDDYLPKFDGYLYALPAVLEKLHHRTQLAREREALRATEMRYKQVIDSVQEAVFRADVQGQWTFLSPPWEEITGYTVEEALGRCHLNYLIHDECNNGVSLFLPLLMSEARHCRYRLRCVRRDGGIRWVEMRATAELNARGSVVGVFGTLTDISFYLRTALVHQARSIMLARVIECHFLPDVLKELAVRLEEIEERMRVSILLMDKQTGLLMHGAAPSLPAFFNDAINGMVPVEGNGSSGTAAWCGHATEVEDVLTHPHWQPYWEIARRAGLRSCWSIPFKDDSGEVLGTFAVYGLQPADGEKPYRPDGDMFVLIGEFARLAGLAVQRMRAIEALRQSAAVFENIRDGVMILDAKSMVVAVNRAWRQLTGYSAAEAIGQHPRFLQSVHHDPVFYADMWSSMLESGYWQGELYGQRKDGSTFPHWLSISAVYTESGATSHFICVMTDLSSLKRSEQLLERLSNYDSLTGLPNRRLALLHLERSLEWAQRVQRHVGVLYIDLDRFKNVNDSLGHSVGDEVLTAVARRFQTALRAKDRLARMGGDEFMVILGDFSALDEITVIARRLIEETGRPLTMSGGQEVVLGASIGISLYPNDGESASQLVQHADAALYKAKDQGRNTFCYYQSGLTEAANERLQLELQLWRALERQEFLLYFQPIIGLTAGVPAVGAEALVRWRLPSGDLVAPGRFIPLAEEIGMVVQIGEWVLREACKQARAWIDNGMPLGRISVNLSVRQFQQSSLVKMVERILQQTGLPPARLELEITESALASDLDQASATLEALRMLGVQLAIDDFGTGYSSLAYLKRFRLNQLKIDQSFVRGIGVDDNDEAIVRATIAMAHSLGLSVVAEGVETEQQLEVLEQLGCDSYQGYWMSKPIPAEAFVELLHRHGYHDDSERFKNIVVE